MSEPIQKRPFTAADGRRFGLAVGAVLLAVALISAVRNRSFTLVAAVGGVGALLFLAGLVIPGRLGPLYRGWMGIAALLSRVTTPVVVAVMYYLMITPVGFLRRAFAGNPLVAREGATGFWVVREQPGSRSMLRQF
jgi:hypothetical protein